MSEIKSKPNIIIVMSDQHSKEACGCYGNEIIRTPNIDKLAKNGVMFDNAYCPTPLCCPSRMSFMTGRTPTDIKIWDNNTALSSNIPTFGHALLKGGYETVLCGRMHFVGPDQRHGFKRIFPEVSTMDNAIGELMNTCGVSRTSLERSGYGQNPWMMYDHKCIEAANEWLRTSRSKSDPFCLIVGTISPHPPYVCEDGDLFHYYKNHVKTPWYQSEYLKNLHPYSARYRKRTNIENLTEEEIRRGKAAYYAMVEELDGMFGSLMNTFGESEYAEDTVVIYVSDHGDMNGDHGMWWKMSFYEGASSVPLIISWPEHFAKGVVNHSLVSLMDIGDTLIDIVGLEKMPNTAGNSFKSLLYGEEDSERKVFSEMLPDLMGRDVLIGSGIGPTGGPARMLRKGDWKYIYYHNEAPELYNLKKDPNEIDNKAEDADCKDILENMLAEILEGWDPDAIDKEAKKQFEEAYYVGIHGHKTNAWDCEGLKNEYWYGAPDDYGEFYTE